MTYPSTVKVRIGSLREGQEFTTALRQLKGIVTQAAMPWRPRSQGVQVILNGDQVSLHTYVIVLVEPITIH